MSVVCVAYKNGVAAIASDTQSNVGDICVHAKHTTHPEKLYSVNGSVIGIVGWSAISDIFEHLITTEKELFKLDSRMEILSTLLILQKKLKDDYFIETREDDDQPVESNQLDALIINKHGIFEISSYRSVHQIKTFWAIGSGRRFALGAMHALYDSEASAKQIVEAGVCAAAEFDKSCGLPLNSQTINTELYE